MKSVRKLSVAVVRESRAGVAALLPAVLEQTGTHLQRAKQNLVTTQQTMFERAQQVVTTGKVLTDGLMREVSGQGPKKTLSRGFAVVNAEDGTALTSAKAAKRAHRLDVTFSDGVVQTRVADESRAKTRSFE